MKTIRIGITGHRILAQSKEKEIETGILKGLWRIVSAFPSCQFTILSSLAEGADCLFVDRAIGFLKAQLLVVLPMVNDEYLEEFTTDNAKEKFRFLLQKSIYTFVLLPDQNSKETAYIQAGQYIVDNCDILIAIWDGKPAQGPGGTGQIVELARKQEKPLIWILAGNRRPGTYESTHLGKNQGSVRFERFADPRGKNGL